MELRDRVGVVFGAGSTLGTVLSTSLAAEEMTLELIDDATVDLEPAVARLCEAYGGAVVGRTVDSSSPAAIGEALDRTVRDYGRIDLVAVLCRLPRTAPIGDDTEDQWASVVNGSLHAAMECVRQSVLRMLPRAQGHVVVLCPCPGSVDAVEGALTTAGRAAIRAYCREIGHELRRTGVRIDFVEHGPVEAPALPGRGGVVERLVTPEEVVRCVLWLATSEPGVRVGVLSIVGHED